MSTPLLRLFSELSRLPFLSLSRFRHRRFRLNRWQPLTAEVLETRQLPAQIVVTSLLDEVREDGEVTLREAIEAANLDQSVDGSAAGKGEDEIVFAPALLRGGSVLISISSGELLITSPLKITGFGPSSTVLDAQSLSRLFRITGGASSVELTGLGLTGGVTFLDPSAEFPDEQNGGAILHEADGTLKLVDCRLSDNQTFGIGAAGGAISTEFGCTLVRCILQNNRTSGIEAPGGAICTFSGYLEISETVFVGNSTLGSDSPGGAVFAGINGADISRSRFLNNSTAGADAVGGALAVGPALNTITPTVSVEDSDFQFNSTVGERAFGGAIAVDGGNVKLQRSQIVGNSTSGAAAPGGGMTARNGSTLELVNSTLAENETEGETSPGGGLSIHTGTLQMTQCTVSGNRTLGLQSHGGGLAVSLGTLQLVQSTVTGNQVGQTFSASGGGVYTTAQSSAIRNTIIAGNLDGGSAPDLSILPADARNGAVRYSLIGRSNGTGLTTTTGISPDNLGNFVGGNTAPLALDARLNPLRANGGRTLTHVPRGDSPAIDSGSTAFAVDNAGRPLSADQRSDAPLLRLRGRSVDIGSVERLTLNGPIVVSTSAYELDADVSAGDLSLPEAIALANANEGTDSITFAPEINGVPISLAPAAGRMDADLVIREAVEIRGNGTTRTILDAGGKRRILDITEDATDVVLENMFLRNGNPDLAGLDAEDHRGAGGAIRMFGPGSLTLRTMLLSGNRTQRDNAPGGAIAFYGGILTILDSTIENNSTSGADSGGGGLLANATRILVSRSTFAGNQTSGLRSDGGALSAMNGGLLLSQVTVSGNRVLGVDAVGGGISCDVLPGAATPEFGCLVSQSTVVFNSTGQAAGGGIASPLSIDLRNSIVALNSASGFQFNNTRVQGTDIWQKFETPLTATASLVGRSNDTTLIPTGAAPNASGNLIGGLTAGTAIDPLLSPLADNGGPTRTHLPTPFSPVIERGRNELAVDVTAGGTPPELVFDQRGSVSKRLLDGDYRATTTLAVVDIGAVEFPGVRLTTPNPGFSTLRPVLRWTALPAVTAWSIHVNSETTGQARVIIATVSTNEYTPTADLPVGSYKIWIQPVYSGSGSVWNTPQIFNVLAAPVLQSMERTQYIARPQLLWNPLPGAVQYDIWGNNVSTGQQQTFRLTVQGTSWTPPADLPLGLHRFWIRGLDAKNQPTLWSVAQEFLVVTVVTPLTPGNSLIDTTPDFTWQPVTGAVSYEFVLRNASTNVVVISQQNIVGTRFTPTVAQSVGNYKWYVLAVSPESIGRIRSGRAITRDVFIGGRTTVLAPSGVSKADPPEFRWQVVDDAATYTIQVSRLIGNSYQKALLVTGITSTSWTPPAAFTPGSYRTWVLAVSGSGDASLWSPPLDFSIPVLF